MQAARRSQALVRGYRARKVAIRRRELQAWSTLTSERTLLAVVVYFMIFIVITFATFLNMLYGVTFSPAQARAWVLSSVLSFVTDAIINRPVVMLVKTIINFLKRVFLTSLDSVLMAKITVDAVKRHETHQTGTTILGSVLEADDEM